MILKYHSIKWKLFVYYSLLFTIFTLSIILYQNKREHYFRTAELRTSLNDYTDLTNRFLEKYSLEKEKNYSKLDSLKIVIPPEKVRITVISKSGIVLYDNSVSNYSHMENHQSRPEFQKAIFEEFGENIRHSATTNKDYFYFAKSYNNLIIRAAVVYDVRIKEFLRADRVFIPFFILLFLVFGFSLRYIGNHLGDSITKLKDFAVKVRRNEATEFDENIEFPNDELGSISQEIIQLYHQLNKTKSELLLEKEKLVSHLYVLKEGIAFFSPTKKAILNNSHFIIYLNIISEETTTSTEKIFKSKAFEEINSFLDKTLLESNTTQLQEMPRMQFTVQKNSYHFTIQCIIFPDKSFEILIADQTELVKRSIMKQQITSNISHELKTPISSVKGYLETVLNNPSLEQSKQQYFIKKAYIQSERLTQLVNDIAILNKIEEYSDLYIRGKIQIGKAIEEAIESRQDQLKNKSITVENSIEPDLVVNANYSLIFSIFRNLIENSVIYGGEKITIWISKYHEDASFYFFSFADNGPGVEEEHLPRLFERFYRVDSGRSRKQGGTGLGLAIVKNAVLSFKGDISARPRQGGGLEFIFSLPK